jgi:hypothetical protein
MDRTRLRYNLTSEGMSAFTRNAVQYMKDSLQTYRDLRHQAREMAAQIQRKVIQEVHIEGSDEVTDILRLTCMEAGITLQAEPGKWTVHHTERGYELKENTE